MLATFIVCFNGYISIKCVSVISAFGTRNVISLYTAGWLMTVAKQISKYLEVLISLWLFLFVAQPKEFFLDGLKKLEQRSRKYATHPGS
jgi:hypothetical protein